MPTIFHASDLHFGKAFDSGAAQALRQAMAETAPDLIVLSGDFTQRAKVREFQEAREFLRCLPSVPLVVTPGNHDVPMYRVWERVLAPHRNYREHISPDLDSAIRVEGVSVVALDSSAPHSALINGRLRERQLRFAAETFRRAPPGDLKVVVTHHNLQPAPDYGPFQVLPGFARVLGAFSSMGVDLVLGGHLHRCWVGSSRNAYPEGARLRGIVIAHAGTATSTRGRAGEEAVNSFNRVVVDEARIEVTHFLRSREAERFLPWSSHVYPRLGEGGA